VISITYFVVGLTDWLITQKKFQNFENSKEKIWMVCTFGPHMQPEE
jgi:hypothetical protein